MNNINPTNTTNNMKQKQSIKAFATMCAFAVCVATAWAGSKHTYTFEIQRPIDADQPTECVAKTTLLKSLLGVNASTLANVPLKAMWTSSNGKDTYYDTSTSDVSGERGHWFTSTGLATNKSRNYCIKVVWNAPRFIVTHNAEANTQAGNTYTVREALVQGTDTVLYVFNVTIGEAGSPYSVTDNQPAVVGRKSQTDGWLVRPVVRQNEQEPRHENFISVSAGDQITLGCEIIDTDTYTSAKYSWSKITWDAKLKKESIKTLRTYRSEDFVLTQNAEYDDGGMYRVVARLSGADGKVTAETYYFYVDVQEHPGEFKTWNKYNLTYDFHTEYPNLQKPEKIHNIRKKNGQPANHYAGEWWSVFWGDDLNTEVGQVGRDDEIIMKAAKNLVDKYDYDFAYIRDYMGWPPDLSARQGYKSFVYIFGSGLANDNTSKTEKGGYQSATTVDGRSWACVWASYYPFSRFRDDADQKWNDGEYQRNAMVHEGIHATFADLGACQGSSWFHEGGNTWLQGQVYALRDGYHGDAGFLDGGPFLAPHMPIECYSGWLQDGSYGGPAAQGVNMYNGSQQVCTWRNYLGGVQYANAFPTVVANVCGDGSIPWIWRYCKNRVLETMGDTLGDEAMRDVIVQYRARQALFDLGGWDKSYRAVTNNYFGTTVKAEWEPYWINVAPYRITPYQTVELNDSEGWMAPDTLTNPGWSGANIIPIHVSGSVANVEFRPEDTNMRALLCYRTKNGDCYYSQTVRCGNMSIDLTPGPANGVIFCVVVNTDYIYTGDAQRKHHWDYRLRFGSGALAVADPYIKWFFYENTLRDTEFETGIQDVERDYAEITNTDGVKILSGMIQAGQSLQLDLGGINPSDVTVRMVGISGVVVAGGRLESNGSFILPGNLPSGLYVLTFAYGENRDVVKIVVK